MNKAILNENIFDNSIILTILVWIGLSSGPLLANLQNNLKNGKTAETEFFCDMNLKR